MLIHQKWIVCLFFLNDYLSHTPMFKQLLPVISMSPNFSNAVNKPLVVVVSFSSKSSRCFYSQALWARELKFRCHMWGITYHVSHVTCCMSYINIYFCLQSVWPSLWRVCYQRGIVSLDEVPEVGQNDWGFFFPQRGIPTKSFFLPKFPNFLSCATHKKI